MLSFRWLSDLVRYFIEDKTSLHVASWNKNKTIIVIGRILNSAWWKYDIVKV